jgi:GTP-binding protein HflX
VVDAAAPDPEGQRCAVRAVLDEIGAGEVLELLAFNKVDVARADAERLLGGHPGSVAVSALTGDGVDDLMHAVGDRLRALEEVVELVVPYDRGDVLAAVHREGEVLVEAHEADATRVRARLDHAAVNRFRPYVVA